MILVVSVAYRILLLTFNLIASFLSNLYCLVKDRVAKCVPRHMHKCAVCL